MSKYRIDIGVVDPDHHGEFLLGVECDGATYHSSKTARDRDRLRQSVLEGMGWTIHRVWSTEWFRNRERELDILSERIEQARETRQNAMHSSTPPRPQVEAANAELPVWQEERESSESIPSPAQEAALIAAPYRQARLLLALTKNPLGTNPYANGASLVRQAIAVCVREEGPIHIDLLAQRIAETWGTSKMTKTFRSIVEDQVATMRRTDSIVRTGDFVQLLGTDVIPRGKDATGRTRKIEHISSQELRRGIMIVLRGALTLDRSEMPRAVARFFGYARTGIQIQRRIEAELDGLVAAGWIAEVNGRHQPVDRP